MTAEKIIEVLKANKIEIRLKDGRLVVKPASKLTPGMKACIRDKQDELCELLQRPKVPPSMLLDAHKWLVSFDMAQRIGKLLKPPEGARFLLGYLTDEQRQAYFSGGIDWRVWNQAFGRAAR